MFFFRHWITFPVLKQVSEELIRVAILWHEMWHEGLEEASRLYFGERNVKGMFEVLEPLHAMMERGPQTLKETSFNQVSPDGQLTHALKTRQDSCLPQISYKDLCNLNTKSKSLGTHYISSRLRYWHLCSDLYHFEGLQCYRGHGGTDCPGVLYQLDVW